MWIVRLALNRPYTAILLAILMMIAAPALVSTLFIRTVFLRVFFLSDVPRYLMVPLAEAIIFTMLAPYLLSRVLLHGGNDHAHNTPRTSPQRG
jgi:cell division protein FtsW (lipid II flippase)